MPDDSVPKTVEILANHYQKTYEVTYDHWQQRNRLFVILLVVIGAGALLLFKTRGAETLFLYLIGAAANLTDAQVRDVQQSFPFDLLQTILLIVVFHLMFNLYHRAVTVVRNYKYLGRMEKDIRTRLGLAKNEVSFTREGAFYWGNSRLPQRAARYVYVFMLGIPLVVFVLKRVIEDIAAQRLLSAIVDGFIGLLIIGYFVAYMHLAVVMDQPDEEAQPPSPAPDKHSATLS